LKKDDIIVTISHIKSTKSYNLSKFIQKSISYGIIIFIIIFIISFYFISILNNKIVILKDKSFELQTLNNKYINNIQEKKDEIKSLGGTLENIENMIGISINDNITLAKRVEIAKLSTAEKTYMLEVIPNGKPLKTITIVSKFGWRIHPVTHTKKFHKGLDLRAKMNTQINATADGVIKYVQDKNKGQYGKMIIISHNFGFETIYAHLNTVKVKVGDIVDKGQLIAKSGKTGRTTGPHLHYEVRYASKVLNPINFINWNLKNYKDIFKKQGRVQWEYLIKLIKRQSNKLAQQ
jgi:murein DD-endopeptidase MepM/ murein hydrolase activator NlpD